MVNLSLSKPLDHFLFFLPKHGVEAGRNDHIQA